MDLYYFLHNLFLNEFGLKMYSDREHNGYGQINVQLYELKSHSIVS